MRPRFLLALVLLLVSAQITIAQSTAFTYQGKLVDNGNLANISYDMQFKLFDALSGGTQIAALTFDGSGTNPPAVLVTNGIFAVTLDFGSCSPSSPCFNGSPRFLEIAVKRTTDTTFVTLTPRQPISSTPYALKTSNLLFNGAYNDGFTIFSASNTFAGESAGANTTPGSAPTDPDGKFNSFFGAGAGQYTTTGGLNTFIGANAGSDPIPIGNNNTLLGAFTGVAPGVFNSTAIGANAYVTQSNSLILGNYARVGIGTPAPTYRLEVIDPSAFGLRVQSEFAGGILASFGGVGDFQIDAPAFPGGRFIVKESGNVGIGTDAPAAKLHVRGVGVVRALVDSDSNAGVALALGNQPKWSVATISDGQFQIYNHALGSNAFSIDSATNRVGIGTDAPTQRLHVIGNSAFIGNLGIGTTAPNFKLTVADSSNTGLRVATGISGGTVASFGGLGDFSIDAPFNPGGRFIIKEDGNVGIGTAAPDQKLSVNGDASKIGGGSWATFSDERLKTIHGRYTRGLQAVMQLQPIRYEYKRDNALGLRGNDEYIGFSAQEVARILPEAVRRSASGYLQINNDPILWTMLNAVKEQQAQIQHQQTQLRERERQAAAQQSRLAQYESQLLLLAQELAALKRMVCASRPGAEGCRATKRKQ